MNRKELLAEKTFVLILRSFVVVAAYSAAHRSFTNAIIPTLGLAVVGLAAIGVVASCAAASGRRCRADRISLGANALVEQCPFDSERSR